MSAEPIELASTYVSVGISTEGLGKQLLRDTKGLSNAFAGLGKKSGSAYANAFSGTSSGATKGAQKDQGQLAKAVETGIGKVRTARDAEAAAARKVKIEETKLAELRAAGAKDSQILQAEDRLANARVKQALATQRVAGEVGKLKSAQNELKAATGQAATAATGMAGKVKTAFAGIGAPFAGLGAQAKKAAGEVGANLKSATAPATAAFTGLVSKAKTSAVSAGTALGQGIAQRTQSALGRLDPFVSMVGRARTRATEMGATFSNSIRTRVQSALSAFDPLRAQVTRAAGTAQMVGSAFGTAVRNRAQAVLAPFQPFAPVVRQAATAAGQAGSNLVNGIRGRVTAGLAAMNPFASLRGKATGDGDAAGGGFVSGVRARLGQLAGMNPFGGLRAPATQAGNEAGAQISAGIESGAKSRGLGGLGTWLKGGLIGIVGGAAAAAGKVFSAGFSRYTSLENANQKLNALSKSLKLTQTDIDGIMKGAQKAVEGTSFSMAEAADVASAAVASNIKPGQQLDQTLKTIANTAAIAGTDMASMGAIFNKAAASGKVQGDILAQLGDRGVPAVQWLAKELGVTAEEVYKLGSDGKISFEQFERAMRNGMDPEAAKMMGDTLSGSMKNFQAAIGRLGGEVMKVAGPALKGMFDGGIKSLNTLTGMVGPFMSSIGDAIKLVQTGDFTGGLFGVEEDHPIVGVLLTIRESIGPVIDGINQLWSGLTMGSGTRAEFAGELEGLVRIGADVRAALEGIAKVVGGYWLGIFTQVGTLFTTVVVPALGALWQSIQIHVIPAFLGLLARAQEIYAVVGPIIQQVVGTIIAKFQELSPQISAAMSQLGAIIGGAMELISAVIGVVLRVIQFLWNAWGQNIMNLVGIVMNTVMGVIRGVMTVIQGVINVVMGIITGDWSRAWQGIRQIFSGIWDTILALLRGAVGVVVQVISAAWNLVRGLFSALRDFVVGLWQRFWDGLLSVGRSILDAISGAIDRGLGAVRGFFQSAVDGIRTIWDGLREAAAAPVRFVINTVINDGIIRGWNELVGLLNLPARLRVGRISIPGLATGGEVPGRWSATRRDPILGVTARGVPHVRIEPQEYVVNRASTRSVERVAPGFMDSLNAGGGQFLRDLVGFARGGLVPSLFGHLPGFWMGGTLPTTGGRISAHRLPYYGAQWAGDLARGMGTPVYAWKAGQVASTARWGHSYGHHIRINHAPGSSLYAHLSQIMVMAGQMVRAGQLIGRVGSTGNSTGPHLHFEIRGGAAMNAGDSGTGGGGILDIAGFLLDKLTTPVRALIDRVPGDGLFVDLAKGVGTQLLDAAIEKIKSATPDFGDSSMTPPTGYWTGTYSATPGWRLVGEQGPELVRFRGREQVADSPTTDEVLSELGGRGRTEVHLHSSDPEVGAARVMDYLRWGKGA